MTAKSTPPPLALEQLALGELSIAQENELREKFGEQTIERELQQLRQSNRELSHANYCAPIVEKIEQRIQREQARARPARAASWAGTIVPAFAAAAVIWLVVSSPTIPSPAAPRQRVGLEVTRLKGNAPAPNTASTAKTGAGEVLIYRRIPSKRASKPKSSEPGVEQLRDGDKVSEGDILQMGYVSNFAYGALLSLDGNGEVTLHWPANANAAPLLPEREALLGFSYELDDSPKFERFFFVASPQSFSVKAVRAAILELGQNPDEATNGPLKVVAELSVTSLTLKKVSR